MHHRVTASVTLSCLLLSSHLAHGSETKISRGALPPAVEAAVAEQAKGATLKGLSKDTEHGKVLYEVELSVDGRARSVTIDAQGKVLEVEEDVPLAALSAAVTQALTAGAGTGTIRTVASLTKDGKLVAYEAVVTRGKKTSEIQVGPEGQKLARPE